MERKKETMVVNEQLQDSLKDWVRPQVLELNVSYTASGGSNPTTDAEDFS